MTVQHVDLFHCQKCGRIDYEPHGSLAPVCCQQPMVRAVSDVVKESDVLKDVSGLSQSCEHDSSEVAEHALLAEAIELSNWCRAFQDIDISRYEELSRRLTDFHRAVADRFDSLDRETGRRAQPRDAMQRRADQELHDARGSLLSNLEQLLRDLESKEASLPGWDEICRRLDSLTFEFRRQEESQLELQRVPDANSSRD